MPATLVAFYGKKEPSLQQLIEKIWTTINQSPLAPFVTLYRIQQIHSTIIGLESMQGYNANAWIKLGQKAVMHFSGLSDTLSAYFPLTIQLGGYPPGFDGFTSLGRRPYERSFQINLSTNKIVLMGWPVTPFSQQPTQQLLKLRDQLWKKHHILHKYEEDNDFYMVLGQITELAYLSQENRLDVKQSAEKLEQSIKTHLHHFPLKSEVGLKDLKIVEYQEGTLDPALSKVYDIWEKNI